METLTDSSSMQVIGILLFHPSRARWPVIRGHEIRSGTNDFRGHPSAGPAGGRPHAGLCAGWWQVALSAATALFVPVKAPKSGLAFAAGFRSRASRCSAGTMRAGSAIVILADDGRHPAIGTAAVAPFI